jgi:anti-sigma regulatory factor (Ser/Thr protein kinase)
VVVLRRVDSGNGAGTVRATDKSVAVELAPGAGCPAEARAALSPLEDALDTQVYLDLSLLVSELVTNCVRHAQLRARDMIRLQVGVSDRVLRVEVSDPGEGFGANVPEPEPRGPGGWGLFLTERLADRWGADRESGWTTVWLEMDLDRTRPLPA